VGLKSFSIYEFDVSAENKHGTSNAIKILQITGDILQVKFCLVLKIQV